MNSQRRGVGHRLGIRTFSLGRSISTVSKKPGITPGFSDSKSQILLFSLLFRFVVALLTALTGVLRLFAIFGGTDGLSGHVAWIVVERSRLFFAWLFLVWVLVVGHGLLL